MDILLTLKKKRCVPFGVLSWKNDRRKCCFGIEKKKNIASHAHKAGSWYLLRSFFFQTFRRTAPSFLYWSVPPPLGRTCCFACVPDIRRYYLPQTTLRFASFAIRILIFWWLYCRIATIYHDKLPKLWEHHLWVMFFFLKRNKIFSPDNTVQMFSISTHTKKRKWGTALVTYFSG